MGEARRVMDRLTSAMVDEHSIDSAVDCYAEDAVIMTPDAGEIHGQDGIGEYWRTFIEAFPDSRYEPIQKHEHGHVAIDEGWLVGTNTAPLPLPTGEVMPATGRQIRVRSCDIATIHHGKIKEHHMYFDQMEFLGQLGLAPPPQPPMEQPS
ncbi:nuclear transport factor 2 family protein [Natronosporangium hydrolyticum]|uniref:Nuclear transport factor 2 family protein n=1 Tax=Natronosporangium hydrolyticum TaxID=2811111 RepID=A0A895YL99_9ACTN|nr:nuclear transport factor 2 family protein [Natronosporangium hydrolyticum]QSB14870.1 nuclear transport factor 2 family protein [Natronosporangium hydrolyticum]